MMRSAAAVAFLVFCLVLLFFIIRGSRKKEPIAFLVVCFIVCAGLSTTLLVSGSQFNFELPGLKFNYWTPSELDKITGHNDPVLTVTSSGTGRGSVLISATSTEPISNSSFHFPTGKEYILCTQQSQDGKELIFDVTLPEGQKIQIEAPSKITMLPLTKQILSPSCPPQTGTLTK